jgi:DNA repair exonuclease SbcCD nuclease subunit
VTRQHADALICGDWHLREDPPRCRTDNYWSAQWKKIHYIRKLQKVHDCPVLQPGDFFDHWKPSPRLLAQTFLNMPDNVLAIYGNHDLPQHSFELRDRCGLYALAAGVPDKIQIRNEGEPIHINDRSIIMFHRPVYEYEVPPWHPAADTAEHVLKTNPEFDLIVTGDVHDRFVVEYKDRLLVNAGSMTRMTADQIDHIPAVYLWYAADNTVQEVLLPIEPDVITRDYLEHQQIREARYHAFIDRLKKEGRPELSFKANLERYFATNSTLPSVQKLIYQLLEAENVDR